MNSAVHETKRWLGPRFLGLVLFCFAFQAGLIFWLGQREAPASRAGGRPGPSLQWASESSIELLKLMDPTFFALPHKDGFSGGAWLSIPSQEIQPFAWTEPPRFLDFSRQPALVPIQDVPEAPNLSWRVIDFPPELLLPPIISTRYFAEPSKLELSGGLQARRLLSQLELPSWAFPDLLSNTVVQVQVDAAGRTFWPTLLERSGLKAADDRAVEFARELRFAPLDPSGRMSAETSWTWGELVFEWRTVPVTNEASAKP